MADDLLTILAVAAGALGVAMYIDLRISQEFRRRDDAAAREKHATDQTTPRI